MLHKPPKSNMYFKSDSGINRGSGRVREYNGAATKAEKRNIGFGDYYVQNETATGKKMLNAVQIAAVGTEIEVYTGYSEDWGRPYLADTLVYRVTGTIRDKKLVPIDDKARSNMTENSLPTEIAISDRDALRSILAPIYNNGGVKITRTAMTDQERRDAKSLDKKERQARAAERRQLKFSFYEDEVNARREMRRAQRSKK